MVDKLRRFQNDRDATQAVSGEPSWWKRLFGAELHAFEKRRSDAAAAYVDVIDGASPYAVSISDVFDNTVLPSGEIDSATTKQDNFTLRSYMNDIQAKRVKGNAEYSVDPYLALPAIVAP